mmetsp:Transcript_21577/g.29834  ORF Transcript_21577/g.29834 Transcript_21577/m.29834 type:complete len:334 (-) Transcript_21577:33-1034(-)
MKLITRLYITLYLLTTFEYFAYCFQLCRHGSLMLQKNKYYKQNQIPLPSPQSIQHTRDILKSLHCANNDADAIELRTKLKGTCLFLVGMMGSGKTSVGKLLADKMAYRFIDTDEIAEFMIEMPISKYFSEGNEQQFRQLEYQILMDLAQYTRVVVSTGGGIVLKQENWGLLRHGIVVYLDVAPEVILSRLDPNQVASRPLLAGGDPLSKLQQIQVDREPLYKQADVHVTVTADLSPQQVADKVVQSVNLFIANNPPMWQTWKKKQDQQALDFAAMSNPKAAMSMSKEVDPTRQVGSVQYVALSDIKSGKVKLPEGPSSKPSPPMDSSSDNELQ